MALKISGKFRNTCQLTTLLSSSPQRSIVNEPNVLHLSSNHNVCRITHLSSKWPESTCIYRVQIFQNDIMPLEQLTSTQL